MRNVLLISDNEILNDLYVLNLEVYTGTNVTVVTSVENAIKFLSENKNVEVAVTLNMINGQDCAIHVQEFLEKSKLDIPLIVVGSLPRNMFNVINVPSTYNLQNLIKVVAKMLGVTAKEMAEKIVSPYFPVPIKSVIGLEKAPCNVYLELKKENELSDYILILKKDFMTSSTIKKLFEDGVSTVYVEASDRLKVVNQITLKVVEVLKIADTPISKKVDAHAAGFEIVASQLLSSPEAAQELIELSQMCVKTMEDISKEAPSLRGLMSILNSSKESYLYIHAMLSSYVGQHIVRNISWGGDGHVEKINFVLFFHDIALAPIYLKYPHLRFEEDILFDEKIPDKDKEIVLNHARISAELMSSYKRMPMGADLLMKQHHGMQNGVGFAIEFKDDISPLSKVVLVSEAFVEEMMRIRDENPKATIEVNEMIFYLNDKFKKHTYKKIIETLSTIKL